LPGTGGKYALGARPNMRKICAKYAQKYAQNMRNPKNGVGSGIPYLITHALLLQNMMIFFDQKGMLNHLSTLKAPF
jgi:hypothetical protein